MSYIYSAGANDAAYSDAAYYLFDIISKNDGKVCGSSALWYIRKKKKMEGKYYKYFQTKILNIKTNEKRVIVRNIDVLVSSQRKKMQLIEKLNEIGSYWKKCFQMGGLEFRFRIYRKEFMPIVPFASRNYWITTVPFEIGTLTNKKEGFDEGYSLENLIYNTQLLFNYWDNIDNIPNHTSSGDPIRFKIDSKENHSQHLDLLLNKNLDVGYIDLYIPNTYKDIVNDEVCAICLDDFKNERPIFKTVCNHFFHIGCIAKYVYNYYIDLHSTSIQTEVCQVNNEEKKNNKCPMCRSNIFNIDIILGKSILKFDFIRTFFTI